MEFFSFRFDYHAIIDQYNEVADENNWTRVENPEKYVQQWTRFPCLAQSKKHAQMEMKAPKKRPDKFLMEFKHFFPLISYYLPAVELD